MKRFKKIVSILTALLFLFSNFQLPYFGLVSGVNATEGTVAEAAYVTEAVYTDAEIVALDNTWLTADLVLNGNNYTVYQQWDGPDYYNITGDLNLPVAGANGSTISWASSDTTIVAVNGAVYRPSWSEGSKNAMITATISKGVEVVQKTFHIYVSNLDKTADDEAVMADSGWLWNEYCVLPQPGNNGSVTDDVNLPLVGKYGSTITWASDNEAVVATDGTVTRPVYPSGDVYVTLTATIAKGNSRTETNFYLTVKQTDSRVTLDEAWLTADLVLNGNSYVEKQLSDGTTYYYNITGNLNMPVTGPNGSTISWASTDEAAVETNGTVHRQVYGDEVATVTATISIGDGAVQVKKSFNLCVSSVEQAPDASLQMDQEWLTPNVACGDWYTDQVTWDLPLPILGKHGSMISWTSSNPAVVAVNGKITRPKFLEGDKEVTVTATIYQGDLAVQSDFWVNIVALAPTDSDDVAVDKAWLTPELVLNGNSAVNVKTKLYLPTQTDEIWSPSGYYGGSTITWASSNPDVVATDGTVTRPDQAQGDQQVRLTATITNGETVDTKTFDIVVTVVEEFPLALKYDDFSSSGDTMQFNGKSSLTNTLDGSGNSIQALQFTDDGQALGGSVFTKNKIHLNDDMSFSTYFAFRNDHSPYAVGDGGFTFTLQAVNPAVYGQGLAALGAGGIKPSLSIAFKSLYYRGPDYGQAPTYGVSESVAVFYNGNNNALTNMGSHGDTHVWIEYDGPSKVLEIRTSYNAERPRDARVRLENVDIGQSLRSAETNLGIADVQDVYAGFTGSVGDAQDKIQIHKWYFKNESTPIDLAPYIFNDVSDVSLSANPPGGQASSTVTASVYGGSGPVTGIPVAFSTTFGSLSSSSAVTNSSGQASVVLSATTSGNAVVKAVASGGAMASTEVSLTVIDEDRAFFDRDWLTDERVLNGNSALNNITKNLLLPTLGLNGSDISWTSSNPGVVALDGTVIRPGITQGDQVVTLKAAISKGSLVVEKTFVVTVKILDEDAVAADREWLTDARVLNGNSAFDNVTTNLNLLTLGVNGSTISWSSVPATVASNGTVTRPTYGQGDQAVTLTATISKGSVVVAKIFNLTVKKLEPTDEEAVTYDRLWLTEGIILNGNSIGSVTGNLSLPVLAPLGSTITWTSSDGTVAVPDGTVSRPVQGNQAVILTASISKGSAAVVKTFDITVKGLGPTDAEIVDADSNWLIDGTILNGNSSLANVLTDLSLPALGPQGSTITWVSSDGTVIAIDGTVHRPYSQGDRAVTITATLSKGSVVNSKTFNITVKVLSDVEALALDNAWLTDELVLNGNTDLNHVTTSLNLPVLGPKGTIIRWVSTNTNVVEGNGTVKRPTWIVEKVNVTLRATLIKGADVASRSFELVVLALAPTGEQAVAADAEWLQVYRTLGQNLSQYAINQNLSLPASGYYGSSITWNSSMPGIISESGIVTRPEYWEGHKSVTMTAFLNKGGAIAAKDFKYTVLAKPDIIPPKIISTTPENNSTGVLVSSEITITFDEDIKQGTPAGAAGSNTFGIELLSPDSPVSQQISARIYRNKLIITPYSFMASGENKLVVPAGALTDMSGNPAAGFELPFSVEQRLINKVEVDYSSPQDLARDVRFFNPYIVVRFNSSVIVKGSKFSDISLRPRGGMPIPVNWVLQGRVVMPEDSLTLRPETVYELILPAGAVQDRFNNDNSAKIIQFRTEGLNSIPKVTSTYPLGGQNGVDIHQAIEINFSEVVKAGDCRLELKDNKGNLVRTYIKNTNASQAGVIMIPYTPLQPNTEYTVAGPYDSAAALGDFRMSFKTGAGSLGITKISPTSKDNYFASINDLMGAPVNAPVEITFSAPVTRGPEYANIQISDSQGNPVTFGTNESGNKAVLTPSSELSPAETYTVSIPGGAYRDAGGSFNDSYKFRFATAGRLEPGSFLVNPSSTWLVNKPLTFDTSGLEAIYKREGYEITSFVWNFGDGTIGTGKSPTHTYDKTGVFVVALWLNDNMGFSNYIVQRVTIEDLSKPTMSVIHDGGDHLYVSHYGSDTKRPYKIRLEYNGQLVPGETIKVQLYKNGVLQNDFGTVTAGSTDNEYLFPFTYQRLPYNGTYELVFTYDSLPEKLVVREPVIIHGTAYTEPLRIKLYDTSANKYYEVPDSLNIELNGEKKVAVKEWYSDKAGYGYTVKESLDMFQDYSFKVDGWVSDTDTIYHGGSYYGPSIVEGRPRKPGINRITRDVKNYLFIEGVKIGAVTYKIDGDWDGLEPGYYEMKTDSDRLNTKSSEPKILLDPGNLRAGETLLFRMVSKNGVKSAWRQLYFHVVPRPSLGLGLGLNVSYVKDGEYVKYSLSAPVGLNGLGGGRIPLLDGVPLIAGDESFGVSSDKPTLSGTVDERELVMTFGAGGSYSYTKKTKKTKKKVVSVGYEFEAEIDGELWYEYDYGTNDWKLLLGIISLDGYGGKKWTKGYHVPKIDIGVDGKVEIGARLGGSLKIDRRDGSAREYSGILRFEPIVTVSIQGGPDWVNVTGYVDGRIPAELHIPTGYAEAEVSLTAGVTATFLTYTEDLYKKELFNAHWDNGKEKITLQSLSAADQPLIMELDTADAELKPTPRNYLNRESQWLAGSRPLAMGRVLSYNALAVDETNPQVLILKNNIYPDAEVQLVRNGNELWLVWTDDNPERSAVNRTQMSYSLFKDGTWSAPVWLGEDGTADFTPVLASTGNGILMAWQNMKQAVEDDAGLGALIESAEISVTGSAMSVDSSDLQATTLTNDDKFDHSPKLAADGDKALLVWTKSEGLGFTLGPDTEAYQAPANSDRLFYSGWDGSTWSTPVEIAGSLPTVMNSSLAMHGEEGLLLYTLDMDNNQSTQDDRELFARIYDGSSWGEVQQITDNQVPDASPKAVYINGEWFITWHQNDSIMFKEGLAGEIKTEEFLENVQSDYEVTVKNGAKPQVALVYKHIGEDRVHNLSASFHDIASGVWSDEIPLTEDAGYVSSFSPVFTGDGRLKIAYTQAEIITEAVEGAEYKNVSDKVDLRSLTYTPVHDLALDAEDGLEFSPEIPLPGTTVTVSATIRNQGDYAENAALYLYDGPPESGVKIGEAATAQPIPARSSAQVEVRWLVDPAEKDQYDIYAVVRSNEGVTEIDEGNNTINQKILTADAAVTNLECKNIAGDDYLVKAKVANTGSKVLEGVKIQVDQGLGGNIIETRELGRIEPGQEKGLNFVISAQGLTRDENGRINMTFRALLPDGVSENSTENNTSEFVLEPAPILVESTNPGQGETQVGIQKPITINFNMNVENGAGFDQMILQDDDLNPVGLTKTLAGNTLTLTPQSPMAYNTRYTLTIPRDALGDAYGHTMDEPYSLSFVTTASSPEVVFAYPGSNMGEVAVDTVIKMQFNQVITNGPTFGNIAMYGPNSEKISASVSKQGEWLYISPAGQLNKGTSYSLMIPRGAVQNGEGEAQQEDYAVEFMTTATDGGNVPPDPTPDPTPDLSSDESDTDHPAYEVSRQTSDDGSSTASVNIDQQAIANLNSNNQSVVTLDLTAKVKEDEKIQVNLAEGALSQLAASKMGLNVVTGKGNLRLPAGLVASLVSGGEKSVTITIAENNQKLTANDRVSAGIFDFTITAGDKPVTKFDQPVSVTIPLNRSKSGNAKRVIVCVYDELTGSWRPVGGVADTEKGTITFNTSHFSTYAAFETIKHFVDVTSSWAKEKVEVLASRRVLSGTTDKTFNPKGSITRAEFTALAVRSLYTEPSKSKGSFADVDKGSWYADTVETAYELGLVSGAGADRFTPDAKISREQLATIAYRLYKYKAGTNTIGKTTDKAGNAFKDSRNISSYAEEAVNFVTNAGIMVGSGGRFEPQRSTTRQEAAVVLYKLLEYMGEL